MTKIVSDWREVDRELDRLGDMPTAKARALLDAVLTAGFAATQAATHIQTGSLKSSGKKSSSVDRMTSDWSGEIEYGGISEGVNNPVDYAIYEQRRHPDELGDHDFMRPLDTMGPAWVAAVLGGLSP